MNTSNTKQYPLTFTQLTYLSVELIDPGCLNLCNGFHLKGEYDLEKLKKAVTALYQRHDALRMVLNFDGEVPYLAVAENIPTDLIVRTLSSTSRDERYNEAMIDANKIVKNEGALCKTGMYRYFAYELSNDELLLMYTANHVATDGMSMGMLNMELEKLYEDPTRVDLPQSNQFGEFLIERNALVQSEEYQQRKMYWAQTMKDYTIPEVTNNDVNKVYQSTPMENDAFVISIDKIKKIARQNRTSNFNIIFLLIQLALAKKLKRNDINLNYIFAGRFQEKYRGTIGFLAHLVNHRTIFDESKSISNVIKEQKDVMNENAKQIDYADDFTVVPDREFLLSYMPNNSKEVKTNFANLNFTPFALYANIHIGQRLSGFIATELPEYIFITLMCDYEVYGQEFSAFFGPEINRYVDMILENPNITVEELVEDKKEVSKYDEIILTLSQLWQNVLELDELPNIEDDFFDLSGNSYKAFFVITNLPEEFQGMLEINDFYEYETLGKIGQAIFDKVQEV